MGKGATPGPDRPAVCGLPGALSVTLKVAVRWPGAVGLKVTLEVQLVPTASKAGQLFACEKSPMSVPVIPTAEMFRGAVPVFWIWTMRGELCTPTTVLGNIWLVGEKVTTGAGVLGNAILATNASLWLPPPPFVA